MAKRKKIVLGLLLLIVAGLSLALVIRFGCLIKLVFGIPCPGCGMTRAMLYVLQLKLTEALQMNAMVFLWGLLFLYLLLKRDKKRAITMTLAVCLITFAYWLIRMFLFFPDTPPLDYEANNLLNRIFTHIF